MNLRANPEITRDVPIPHLSKPRDQALLMITAFYALFTCCVLMNIRAELVQREKRTNWVKKLAGTGA